MVDQNLFATTLKQQIDRGNDLLQVTIPSKTALADWLSKYRIWADYSQELLTASFSDDSLANEFKNASGPLVMGISLREETSSAFRQCAARVTKLQSIESRLPFFLSQPVRQPGIEERDAIFIVHGHDNETKNEVARFLEKLTSLRVDILHELPSGGKTLIEKLEKYARRTCIAVIILTADDVGGVKPVDGQETALYPRARQNVILELGFFLGSLGRARVVTLYEERIEPPSDMAGVVYVVLDQHGAWRTEILREIMAAGVDVDPKRAFGGSAG